MGYGWHFPELTKIVTDQVQFAKLVTVIQERSSLKVLSEAVDADAALYAKLLEAVGGDKDMVVEVVEAAKTSMGIEVSKVDMLEMVLFAKLYAYLVECMEGCAPNLTALIGEQVGARLISKAGSLLKLAKYPASTLQILGAEKALFRALKSKGKCNMQAGSNSSEERVQLLLRGVRELRRDQGRVRSTGAQVHAAGQDHERAGGRCEGGADRQAGAQVRH